MREAGLNGADLQDAATQRTAGSVARVCSGKNCPPRTSTGAGLGDSIVIRRCVPRLHRELFEPCSAFVAMPPLQSRSAQACRSCRACNRKMLVSDHRCVPHTPGVQPTAEPLIRRRKYTRGHGNGERFNAESRSSVA
jgi:hypothetical protein